MTKPITSAMVSVQGLTLSDEEKYLLEKYNPLGVTLFVRNIETPEQVKGLIKKIKETIGRGDVLIASDQEGGRVARFKPPFFREYMPQCSIGALHTETLKKRASFLQALLICEELLDLGVNLNYAPCVDVLSDKTAKVLKSRCFSSDEQEVALLAEEMIAVYIHKGIIPCIKHAPGHGKATVDPHLELPVLNYPLTELRRDFYPFKYLSPKVPMMMTAHIVIKDLDNKPVTQSKKVISEIIRGEMAFDGFLISDAIDMRALKGSLREKTKCSLEAGCDAVCYCMGSLEGLSEVLSSSSFLSDKSLERYCSMSNIISNSNGYLDFSNKMVEEYQNIKKEAPLFKEDYDAVEVLHQLKG